MTKQNMFKEAFANNKMKNKVKDNVFIHKNKCIDFCDHVMNKIVRGSHPSTSDESVSQVFICGLFIVLGVFLFFVFVGIPTGYLHHNYIETYNMTDYNETMLHENQNNIEHYFITFSDNFMNLFALIFICYIPVTCLFLVVVFLLMDIFIVIPYKSWKKDYRNREKRLADLELGSDATE